MARADDHVDVDTRTVKPIECARRRAGGIDAARYIEPFGVLGIRQAFKTGQWNYVLRVITK